MEGAPLLPRPLDGDKLGKETTDVRTLVMRFVVVVTLCALLGVGIASSFPKYRHASSFVAQKSAQTSSESFDSKSALPHILFFFVDDMGHADIGYQSTDLSKATPFMDSLAASGVKLTSYYTQVGLARWKLEAKALDSGEEGAAHFLR